MERMQNSHKKKVELIAKQTRYFYKSGKKARIYHGSTNSTREMNFKKDEIIDTSTLNEILEINKKGLYALVESNVPMDKLVEATLKKGMVPTIVMEFPGITVGGGIQGGAGESSSYRRGLFHQSCKEYEVVLGNGTIVNCSGKNNGDLFHGVPCSYGSLGIITATKVNLIPTKKYVHLQYYRVGSFKKMLERLKAEMKGMPDYIDGIMFSKTLGVIMVGNRSESRNLPIKRFTRAYDEWFYVHVEKKVKTNEFWEELIPTKDYLFRYDRGAFWMGRYSFKRLFIPFTRVTRYLFNSFLKTRNLYQAMHAAKVAQQYIIQDIGIPEEKAVQFLEYADKRLGIYPIWICPSKTEKKDELSPSYIKSKLAIDIGIWGEIKEKIDFLKINRELEIVTNRLHGRKVLYANVYDPEKEFWQIYDKKWYDGLRRKYHAERVFPSVYEKVYVKDKYKPSIKRGLKEFLFPSKNLLFSKK